MNKNFEDILLISFLVCFCIQAWGSVFIAGNLYCAIAFLICILIWLWGWKGKDEH